MRSFQVQNGIKNHENNFHYGNNSVSNHAHIDKLKPSSLEQTRKVSNSGTVKKIFHDLKNISFVSKLRNFFDTHLNILIKFESFINNHTILSGASSSWDASRLKEGKHKKFEALGAEPVTLISSVGDTIDAKYLEASSFIKKIEEFGGKKKSFQLESTSLYQHREIGLKLQNNEQIHALEISMPPIESAGDPTTQELEIAAYYSSVHNLVMVKGQNGVAYAVTNEDYAKLADSKALNESNAIAHPDVFTWKDEEKKLEGKKKEFPEFGGFYFEDASKAKELKQLLIDMRIGLTPWQLTEADGKMFLIKKENKDDLARPGTKLNMHPTKDIDTKGKGTILLSMNQTGIYEQYPNEFLTYALEGINVFAYNNGGKGLSKGDNAARNINAAIEASYQFLRQVKQVPDELILAKGQCFGGAPTAWLGRQHPNINIMLDQTPANFTETTIKHIDNKVKEFQKSKNSTLAKVGDYADALIKFLKKTYIIDGIVKALIAGYNLTEDIKHNKGHKLIHIDIQNNEGKGGDDLVPEHHPEELIAGALQANAENKQTKLTYMPGGVHVTDWFNTPTGYRGVVDFFNSINLTTNLYEKA